MTQSEQYGEVVDARIDGGKIVYTAKHPNGDELEGVITKNMGSHIVLTDHALEEMAEEIIGEKIEWPHQ